jgi:phosphatidylglycerol:prolipoprotein diacylglycerol transferase
MSALNYIIWNGSPELFSIGPVTLRWYGLLFALGFLISQQILYYMYRQEGKPQNDVDTLTIYMVIATIIGARLGHIIFYEPETIWENPLSIFLPFEFNPFRFTGLQGLASHGGAIGILFALWLYSNYSITFSRTEPGVAGSEAKTRNGVFITKRIKPGQSYLQVLDRIVILVALTGALIRLGNYFNSEILGKPSDAPTAVVFISRVTDSIMGDRDDPNNIVESVTVHKNELAENGSDGRVPIKIFIFFKPGIPENRVGVFCRGEVKKDLFYASEFVEESPNTPLAFETIYDEKANQVMARVYAVGIARHPAQLYESISCVLLFIFLFSIWARYKINLPEGRIFGYFMIILWSLRFTYEFLKISQVSFEDSMPLNMGQILSIPMVLVGIVILVRSYRKAALNP